MLKSVVVWIDANFNKLLLAAGLGAILGALTSPLKTLLDITAGVPQWDEESRAKVQAQLLTEDDIKAIDHALHGVADLESLATKYSGTGYYAKATLVRALASHVFGISPSTAKMLFDDLLASDHPPIVRRYLYFRRAKVRALLGEAAEALQDLDNAIELTPSDDPRGLISALRQAANHAYIATPATDILLPDRWNRMKEYLLRADETMGIRPTWDMSARTNFILTSNTFHGVGLGVLLAENAIKATEWRDSPAKRKQALEANLQLLNEWEQYDPISAWNSHTPLAALAISLGELNLARQVLDRAASIADAPMTRPAACHAALQRKDKGVEWLFYKVELAALHIAHAKRAHDPKHRMQHLRLARSALKDPLSEPFDKTMLLRRAARLYERQALYLLKSTKASVDHDLRVFNIPARTHWTYFPHLWT